MCVIVPHSFCLYWVRACFFCIYSISTRSILIVCFSLEASGKKRAREWLARTVDFLITFFSSSSSCWTVSLEDKSPAHQGVALFFYKSKTISILTHSAFGFSFCSVSWISSGCFSFFVCLSVCCFPQSKLICFFLWIVSPFPSSAFRLCFGLVFSIEFPSPTVLASSIHHTHSLYSYTHTHTQIQTVYIISHQT